MVLIMARVVAHITCRSTTTRAMSRVLARAVACVKCLSNAMPCLYAKTRGATTTMVSWPEDM